MKIDVEAIRYLLDREKKREADELEEKAERLLQRATFSFQRAQDDHGRALSRVAEIRDQAKYLRGEV